MHLKQTERNEKQATARQEKPSGVKAGSMTTKRVFCWPDYRPATNHLGSELLSAAHSTDDREGLLLPENVNAAGVAPDRNRTQAATRVKVGSGPKQTWSLRGPSRCSSSRVGWISHSDDVEQTEAIRLQGKDKWRIFLFRSNAPPSQLRLRLEVGHKGGGEHHRRIEYCHRYAALSCRGRNSSDKPERAA